MKVVKARELREDLMLSCPNDDVFEQVLTVSSSFSVFGWSVWVRVFRPEEQTFYQGRHDHHFDGKDRLVTKEGDPEAKHRGVPLANLSESDRSKAGKQWADIRKLLDEHKKD